MNATLPMNQSLLNIYSGAELVRWLYGVKCENTEERHRLFVRYGALCVNNVVMFCGEGAWGVCTGLGMPFEIHTTHQLFTMRMPQNTDRVAFAGFRYFQLGMCNKDMWLCVASKICQGLCYMGEGVKG